MAPAELESRLMDDDGHPSQGFWELIDERQRPGANVAAVDARIWKRFGRTAAIVFTDLSGFSRQVAEYGILHFLQTIREQNKLLLPVVRDHDGTVVKIEADSLMILFDGAASALRCAIAMQRVCQKVSVARSPADKILLCVGIGYGPVLRVDDNDVYGQEVNAASKLGEDTSGAHEILVTDAVKQAASAIEGASFEELRQAVSGVPTVWRVLYETALD